MAVHRSDSRVREIDAGPAVSERASVEEQLREAETRVAHLRMKLEIIKATARSPGPGAATTKIERFLNDHPRLQFSPTDIAIALRMTTKMENVRAALKRLTARGRIMHVGYGNYFSVRRP